MNLRDLVKYIDFTTLNGVDTEESVQSFILKVKNLETKGLAVAGICAFSNFSNLLVQQLKDTSIKSVVVTGGFPHSQVPIEVKLLEVEMAASEKVDEIDIVISRNLLLSDKLNEAKNELLQLKKKAGDSELKIILETCEIESKELLQKACLISMEAGADFIKTSTGKGSLGADLESFELMCHQIKLYHEKTSMKIGIKAAGGIKDFVTAKAYIEVVEKVLGKEWLTPKYFRIGASSLLNELE